MQVSVKFNGTTMFLQASPGQTIGSLRASISSAHGVDASSVVLLHSARALEDTETVMSCGIRNLGVVSACQRVVGGGGNMSENDRAMAMRIRNCVKICRRCYARVAEEADHCRKCWNKDLRPKKAIKSSVKK